jgi:hypothetical protein
MENYTLTDKFMSVFLAIVIVILFKVMIEPPCVIIKSNINNKNKGCTSCRTI